MVDFDDLAREYVEDFPEDVPVELRKRVLALSLAAAVAIGQNDEEVDLAMDYFVKHYEQIVIDMGVYRK